MTRDKVIGMFLGTAIGDALGMPVETMTFAEIAQKHGRVTGYLRPDGHKWHNGRPAGGWTDDTFFSIITAESLIACGKIDMDDIARRHAAVSEEDMKKYGCGRATILSARRLKKGIAWSESGEVGAAGNGVVMKIGPLALYLRVLLNEPKFSFCLCPHEKSYDHIFDFTVMTHNSGLAIEASFAHVYALNHLLRSRPENFSFFDFLAAARAGSGDGDVWHIERRGFKASRMTENLAKPLHELMENYSGRLWQMGYAGLAALFGDGDSYVYHSLPFSYAYFLRYPHDIRALYDVVNAGGDTDSNGSIVGGMLGALHGAGIFPPHLVDGLWRKDEIIGLAHRFCDRFRFSIVKD